jgi:hypothetical protein
MQLVDERLEPESLSAGFAGSLMQRYSNAKVDRLEVTILLDNSIDVFLPSAEEVWRTDSTRSFSKA